MQVHIEHRLGLRTPRREIALNKRILNALRRRKADLDTVFGPENSVRCGEINLVPKPARALLSFRAFVEVDLNVLTREDAGVQQALELIKEIIENVTGPRIFLCVYVGSRKNTPKKELPLDTSHFQ